MHYQYISKAYQDYLRSSTQACLIHDCSMTSAISWQYLTSLLLIGLKQACGLVTGCIKHTKKEAHFLANELLALGESLKSLFGISIKS